MGYTFHLGDIKALSNIHVKAKLVSLFTEIVLQLKFRIITSDLFSYNSVFSFTNSRNRISPF